MLSNVPERTIKDVYHCIINPLKKEIPAYLLHHRVPKVIGDDIVFLISFYTTSAVNNMVYTHANVNAQESIALRVIGFTIL